MAIIVGREAQRIEHQVAKDARMKLGMNMLLWAAELHDGLAPVFESLKAMGYDGIEAPLYNYDLDYAAWRRRLDDLGLERTAVTVRTAADNPISPDPAIRAASVDANRRAVDCAAALGGRIWLARFTRRSESSQVRDRPRRNGIGASTACDRLRNMPERPV